MLRLKHLSSADRGEIKKLLGDNPTRICETTCGVLFLWDVNGDGLFAVEDGALFLASVREGKAHFNFPIGGDEDAALQKIRDYCLEKGLKLRFRLLSEGQRSKIEAFFGAKGEADRDWADYLYSAEELKTLSGKKFHGQKNHLNRFLKSYPDHVFMPYTADLKDAAMEFFDEFYGENEKNSELFYEEKKVFLRLLEGKETAGEAGGVLFAGGKIVAMSFGERAGDTLYVHFEKALREYPGSYAAINYMFVNRYGDGVKYVNREEDVGDEGLRTAKTGLHPVMLVDKYFADVTL